ncbi:hypothetical protein NLI96_g6343 [Meripilus lineatus]|uniref:ClpP/crotonase n=1 Tax=Meripilus lineatus TaxID=2056292 RepID=A0AAD5V116_9APHY|nr:hypothetical protein NLI96_g6343 [Physisporinus lineatus]
MSFPLSFPTDRPFVTVTHPNTKLWVIELHNGADSRLTTAFIEGGLKPALDAVEKDWRDAWRVSFAQKSKTGGEGALIIVGNRSQNKFFSNGLDFQSVVSDPAIATTFFPVIFNPLMRRIVTFPIPTIAAINGHAFAAGMILSLCCDYRVMTDGSKRNAWMCMNEIHFGAGLPLSLTSIIRTKVSDARLQRKIALEGHRFTPQEALEGGLIDQIVNGDTEAVIAKAQELANTVSHLPRLGSYGVIKRELYRDFLEDSCRDVSRSDAASEDVAAKARL